MLKQGNWSCRPSALPRREVTEVKNFSLMEATLDHLRQEIYTTAQDFYAARDRYEEARAAGSSEVGTVYESALAYEAALQAFLDLLARASGAGAGSDEEARQVARLKVILAADIKQFEQEISAGGTARG